MAITAQNGVKKVVKMQLRAIHSQLYLRLQLNQRGFLHTQMEFDWLLCDKIGSFHEWKSGTTEIKGRIQKAPESIGAASRKLEIIVTKLWRDWPTRQSGLTVIGRRAPLLQKSRLAEQYGCCSKGVHCSFLTVRNKRKKARNLGLRDHSSFHWFQERLFQKLFNLVTL